MSRLRNGLLQSGNSQLKEEQADEEMHLIERTSPFDVRAIKRYAQAAPPKLLVSSNTHTVRSNTELVFRKAATRVEGVPHGPR